MGYNRVIGFSTCSKAHDLANGMAGRIQEGTWLHQPPAGHFYIYAKNKGN